MSRLRQSFSFLILISLLISLLLAIKTDTIARSFSEQLMPFGQNQVGSDEAGISYSAETNRRTVQAVGQIGGPTVAVFVDINYAYIGVGPRLMIMNIADPTSPTVVGQSEPLVGIVQDIYLSGNYAYVASGHGGLQVIDVSNPASPQQVGTIDTSGYAGGVVVAGNYAYVADGNAGLRVIEIATPSNPREVGLLNTSGTATKVAVAGSYAYVADGTAGLRVIDIATPSQPTEIGSMDTPNTAKDVAISGRYAYVADRYSGLRVIDISNSANPQEVGSIETPDAWGVTVTSRYAYVADYESGLLVIDISSSTSPQQVGVLGRRGFSSSVAVTGGYAYLASDYRGLRVVNIAAATNPQEVASYDMLGTTQGVTLVGSYAYIADANGGFRVVNISNPEKPQDVGGLNTVGQAWQVEVVGQVAYLVDGTNGLRVIDVSDPSQPITLGAFNTSGYAKGIAVTAGMAYIADGPSGLRVIDISNPTNPQEVGSLDTSGSANSVTIAGTYAYVADGNKGLVVVNISNPTNPQLVGVLDTERTVNSVAIARNHAYLADGNTLRVINISNPVSPQEVSTLSLSGTAVGVTVAGNYAYIANQSNGLRVINISNPSNLIEVDQFDTPGSAFAVTVAGGYSYVADGSGGLLILRYTPTVATPTPSPTPMPTATPTPQLTQDVYEPDNTCQQARPIENNGLVQPHSFHSTNDVDWISFPATAEAEYLIEALTPLNSQADVVLELYESCNNVPKEAQNHDFSPDVRVRFKALTSRTYYVKLSNNSSQNSAKDSTYNLSVRGSANNANGNAGALILVAGRLTLSDSLQENIHDVTNQVYKLFIKNGYTDDRIYYMATEEIKISGENKVDALPDKQNLRAAITQWARSRVASDRALTLYLMDHGGIEKFYLDRFLETVTPDELDGWLDELEAAVPGLRINVIVEACHSGSFINSDNNSISKPGRVIITSTGVLPLAYASEKGAVFSDRFISALDQGTSLYNAFTNAKQATMAAHPDQTAWLDDNGDGYYTTTDGKEAQRRGFNFAGTFSEKVWPPYIAQVNVEMSNNTEGIISAEVRDDQRVDHVWAVIYSPSYIPPDNQQEILPVQDLPSIRLSDDDGDGIYRALYQNFDELQSGVYRIVVYAEDNNNLQARPKEMRLGGTVYLPLTIR